ncbi:hypothetical protein PPERSA_05144 [Pseudocohnilembus persalinus]|uniref:Uncharacterized protein n=1 Tax=Pseudocohnilembus persalinus TaxID=266149 RepID=A0A0V0QVS9_PSEPJ|nr:hypothetical protein PPERSA_05144 [Pseudocohnilembus persalinus]|eukprot:KRX06531.1 hypothetical protein PPERSA_05144 [Pseudocohnilembus persalinus]
MRDNQVFKKTVQNQIAKSSFRMTTIALFICQYSRSRFKNQVQLIQKFIQEWKNQEIKIQFKKPESKKTVHQNQIMNQNQPQNYTGQRQQGRIQFENKFLKIQEKNVFFKVNDIQNSNNLNQQNIEKRPKTGIQTRIKLKQNIDEIQNKKIMNSIINNSNKKQYNIQQSSALQNYNVDIISTERSDTSRIRKLNLTNDKFSQEDITSGFNFKINNKQTEKNQFDDQQQKNT